MYRKYYGNAGYGNTRKNRLRGRKLNDKQKKQVKTLIKRRQELKFYVAQVNIGAVSTTPGVGAFFAPAQGTNDSQRDGDRAELCGTMDIRMSVFPNTDTYNFLRFIVFQWKPNTTPTAADVLLTGPTGAIDILSQYSHDSRQQYTILMDKNLYLNGYHTAVGETGASYAVIRHYKIKLGKKVHKDVQFVAGTTAGTNKLYWIIMSDSGAIPHPNYSLDAKTFFRDS